MQISKILETLNDIERLRGVLDTDGYHPTDVEISEIRDLLWEYRNELLKRKLNEIRLIFVKEFVIYEN